jgi:hypothetical protein
MYENLAPTRIRSPDRPARSQSLHRLSYPGPFFSIVYMYKNLISIQSPFLAQQITSLWHQSWCLNQSMLQFTPRRRIRHSIELGQDGTGQDRTGQGKPLLSARHMDCHSDPKRDPKSQKTDHIYYNSLSDTLCEHLALTSVESRVTSET